MSMLAIASMTAAAAGEIPSACVAALARALSSSATWTMERRIAGSNCPFITSGEVECAVGKGISWKVTHPFASSVEMTPDTMVFKDEDGVRVKKLDELPYYREIREKTDAFASGDEHAFDGLFDISSVTTPGGGWKLVMMPSVKAMRRLFVSVELGGGDKLETVVFHAENGYLTKINFKEKVE